AGGGVEDPAPGAAAGNMTGAAVDTGDSTGENVRVEEPGIGPAHLSAPVGRTAELREVERFLSSGAAGRVLILCGEAGIGRYLVSRQARRRARGERPVEQGTRRATVRQRLHGRGAPLWRPCEARRPLAHAAGPTARRLRLRRRWTGGRRS